MRLTPSASNMLERSSLLRESTLTFLSVWRGMATTSVALQREV